jgi:hypothetical protein
MLTGTRRAVEAISTYHVEIASTALLVPVRPSEALCEGGYTGHR